MNKDDPYCHRPWSLERHSFIQRSICNKREQVLWQLREFYKAVCIFLLQLKNPNLIVNFDFEYRHQENSVVIVFS